MLPQIAMGMRNQQDSSGNILYMHAIISPIHPPIFPMINRLQFIKYI